MRRTEKYRGFVVPVDWFGNASYQVETWYDKKTDRYILDYRGEQHSISREDYKKLMSNATKYRNQEALFKSSYWYTVPGKEKQAELGKQNFKNAINRYKDIDPVTKDYLINMWDKMSDWQRENFYDTNKKLTEEFYDYESNTTKALFPEIKEPESRPRYDEATGQVKTNQEVLNKVIKEIESYLTRSQRDEAFKSAKENNRIQSNLPEWLRE